MGYNTEEAGDNFVQGVISLGKSSGGGGGAFRHPCKSQSGHCLMHTLHEQSPQISPGQNFATCFKDEIFP